MKYRQAVGLLDSLVNYERQAQPRDGFKLDAIRRLLGLAGDPQLLLERTVLVAGTKGKGSTCCLIESALRGCGLRTGMFLSPHVRSVRERVQLDGRLIGRAAFSAAVARLVPLARRRPVSYFEFTAALAFDVFARAGVDWAVLEVGLGGRLDATNLSDPDVSVITRIGLDHTAVLGRTVRRIAGEKAGIMRAGRPVVIGEQVPAAAAELARRARAAGAMPAWADRQVRVWDVLARPDGTDFSVFGELGAGRVGLGLLGWHQVENCRTALAALAAMARSDPRICLAPALAGLASARVPARCEVVSRDPLVIVDSCHNPDSGAALARVLADHVGQKVVLVYGSLRGKQVAATVRPLAPWVEQAVLTRPDSPRAAALPAVKAAFSRAGIAYQSADRLAGALARARELSAGRTPVVVAGSFYLAGEALALLAPAG
ncbi:MAG: Mur ligase family protein [bacterium]